MYGLGMSSYLIQMHMFVLLPLKSHEVHAHLELEDVNLFEKSHLVQIS